MSTKLKDLAFGAKVVVEENDQVNMQGKTLFMSGGTITGNPTVSGGTVKGSIICGGSVRGATVSGGYITGTVVNSGAIAGGTICGSSICGGKICDVSICGGSYSTLAGDIYMSSPNGTGVLHEPDITSGNILDCAISGCTLCNVSFVSGGSTQTIYIGSSGELRVFG